MDKNGLSLSSVKEQGIIRPIFIRAVKDIGKWKAFLEKVHDMDSLIAKTEKDLIEHSNEGPLLNSTYWYPDLGLVGDRRELFYIGYVNLKILMSLKGMALEVNQREREDAVLRNTINTLRGDIDFATSNYGRMVRYNNLIYEPSLSRPNMEDLRDMIMSCYSVKALDERVLTFFNIKNGRN